MNPTSLDPLLRGASEPFAIVSAHDATILVASGALEHLFKSGPSELDGQPASAIGFLPDRVCLQADGVWSGEVKARAGATDVTFELSVLALEHADRGTLWMGTYRQVLASDEPAGQIEGSLTRLWQTDLRREMSRARSSGRPLSVSVVELDSSQPTQEDDDLLDAAEKAWAGALRSIDSICPRADDTFVIVLPDCPLDEALVVAERLRAAAPNQRTCSMGIAQWDKTEGPEDLVRRASDALAASQEAGQDQAMFAGRRRRPGPKRRRS